MTRVVHCKKDPYDVYIGRPSKWGNPFTHLMGKTRAEIQVESREESIKAYGEWLQGAREVPGRKPPTREEVKSLYGKILGCWCKPLPCHGDILVALSDSFEVLDEGDPT